MAGGLLANPVESYPSVFGSDSLFGGENGVQWMIDYPYALPNLVCAFFLLLATLGISLFLEETSELCKTRFDLGLQVGGWVKRLVLRHRSTSGHAYSAIPGDESMATSATEMQPDLNYTHQSALPTKDAGSGRPKLLFWRMWTPNVSHALEAIGQLIWFKELETDVTLLATASTQSISSRLFVLCI